MDFKVKDVADLLNVSETTIHQWLTEGKIPAYRLNEQYCFSRGEIQNWMMSNHIDHVLHATLKEKAASMQLISPEDDAMTLKGGIKQFNLYRALHKGKVLQSVKGTTKEEIMRSAVEEIAATLDLDSEMLFELLWDRERMQPTALNNGIGVPHTRDFLIKAQDVVFVAFLKEPIEYDALDGLPVHTLFFLFACEDKRHLHLLAKIALLCSQSATLDLLQQHPSKQAFLEYIKCWEAGIKH
ncbi:MAG: PTS sugar transporter subunit IIA [Parachlamydiaceae bacterium]|nr:PTS sugar transporter subunit IIA [Parachlamydiaceae bacterium]